MTHPQTYFRLARNAEKAGELATALIYYLSSFCASYNQGDIYQSGTVAKIRTLQKHFLLSDKELCDMVRSYDLLTNQECRCLLYLAIYGDISGIHTVLGDG